MGIAPFHVLITPTIMKNEDVVAAAEELYAELSDSGLDVLLDDRPDRAGVKFKDGDANGDGVVDGNDFLIWQSGFHAPLDKLTHGIPEPSTALLLLASLAAASGRYRRGSSLR